MGQLIQGANDLQTKYDECPHSDEEYFAILAKRSNR